MVYSGTFLHPDVLVWSVGRQDEVLLQYIRGASGRASGGSKTASKSH